MFYDPSDPQSVEKYSSAVTLSDMEVFLFPEVMYSLVLANIMSPLLWRWRNDPWFHKMPASNSYRRVQRTKQFIMDNFVFNLDLDTWGLTTKQQELHRFSQYINEEVLGQSNALFGYEGDKYYFDIDIRRHFGLDKYTSDIIPYWKTETLEAMHAFRHKPSYPTGAGECVSLAALYASALHVLAGIPLDDIYMMATPLHSQNFIDIRDGILTNNRRIVTKAMWYNGTELSAKARRALQNEKVTVVATNAGYIHTLYDTATIPRETYHKFSSALRTYLTTDITFEILASFLRQAPELQRCFQLAHKCCGKPRYIEAERVFHYEHSSKARIGDQNQPALLHDIDEDEFYTAPLPNRIVLDEIEAFFREHPVSVHNEWDIDKLKEHLHHSCYNVEEVMRDLRSFCYTEPRLPSTDKQWQQEQRIDLSGCNSNSSVIRYLESIRDQNPTADLAFSAFRDMRRAPWKPFLKAAMERNPVSLGACGTMEIKEIAQQLQTFENESIYDISRLAQPDEVWNFGRGDGIEKAICLMNIIRNRYPERQMQLEKEANEIVLKVESSTSYRFHTEKEVDMPVEEDFIFPEQATARR
jgi:hypothetical protein